jgi:hypothetical protein
MAAPVKIVELHGARMVNFLIHVVHTPPAAEYVIIPQNKNNDSMLPSLILL